VSVADELEEIQERFGLGYAVIFDDNFTLSRMRVTRICDELIRRDLKLQWKCEARVDGLDPELARLMYRAGCRTVAFGVESGNQQSLDRLAKGATVEEARSALSAARGAGLETVAYVLLGIPGEGPSDALRTLDFCKENEVDFVQFSTLSPFPGTALYDEAIARGWYRATTIRNPADAEEFRATLLPPEWTEQELQRVLKQVYRGFYLRPRYLGRQVLRASRQGSLGRRARLGLSLGRWLAAQQLSRPLSAPL